MFTKPHKHQGWLLIELLMALFLASTLAAMLISTFIGIKREYLFIHAAAALQKNAREVSHLLRYEIKNANFLACEPSHQCIVKKNNLSLYQFKHPIEGFDGLDNAWVPPLPDLIREHVKLGTDVLTVRSVDQKLGRLSMHAYFVTNTHRKSHRSDAIDGLYLKISDQRSEELVSGVADMQIEYLLRKKQHRISEAAVPEWVTADKIHDWLNVETIKVHLLFQSINAVCYTQNHIIATGDRDCNALIYCNKNGTLNLPWEIIVNIS